MVTPVLSAELIDVSDPSCPQRWIYVPENKHGPHNYAFGNDLLLTSGANLKLFDISDPNFIQSASTVEVLSFNGDLTVEGTRAYVANGSVRIVDIADPTNPQLLPEPAATNAYVTAVAAEGGFVFGSGWGLVVLEVGGQGRSSI